MYSLGMINGFLSYYHYFPWNQVESLGESERCLMRQRRRLEVNKQITSHVDNKAAIAYFSPRRACSVRPRKATGIYNNRLAAPE